MFAKANDMNKVPKQNLIFVYNAKSGGLNAVLDYVHKMVSPDTYDCNLCKLTYDNFGQIKKWNDFLTSYNISADYYYRDHLIQIGMNPGIDLPAVFLDDKSLLLGARDINSFKTLEELIEGIKIKIYNQKTNKIIPNYN
tara:strand:+ start:1378 stop:1794 length:417 start_codon:yes stop_codon:yes gene_type:complete